MTTTPTKSATVLRPLGAEVEYNGRMFRVVRIASGLLADAHSSITPCRLCAARCVGDRCAPALPADDTLTRAGTLAAVCGEHPLRCQINERTLGLHDPQPFVAVDDIPLLTLKGYLA